ncbi:MAG TPA: sigma-70 family RNA polymerase sigma factor [Clostridia bacterium]|nr:sigma-70 family RNA polymerase sigma factor [Clostridia bacterium]
MLKSLKRAPRHSRVVGPEPTYADIFLDRYSRLRSWALRLTENEHQAEDVLHDAFIQFTLTRPDLSKIANIDGYLRIILRNVYVSMVRRAACRTTVNASILEYDSAELGLCVLDPVARIEAKQELWLVCGYACERKQDSTAGSVLILRFFHGYYPAEIARVMRVTRQAVANRLLVARSEARLRITHRNIEGTGLQEAQTKTHRPRQEYLAELRQRVFASCQGECIGRSELERAYAQASTQTIECCQIAHIVSCAKCLDEVNRILGLPLLAQRHPSDMLGPDSHDGFDGGAGAADGGGHFGRCAREVYEHRPEELLLSVNGYSVGSQKISSGLMEQTVSVPIAEPVSFIELFSERNVRLMLLNVEDAAIDGAVEQSAAVCLSDNRILTAKLNLSGHWPSVHVSYSDPSIARQASAVEVVEDDTTARQADAVHVEGEVLGSPVPRSNWLTRSCGLLVLPLRALRGLSPWLRPVPVMAVLAVLAALLLILTPSRKEPPAAILARAEAAERTVPAGSADVVHRSIAVEERKPGTEKVIRRRRIEFWQKLGQATGSRRVFDENQKLVAGEWTKPDGTKITYASASATLQDGKSKSGVLSVPMWDLVPAAEVFRKLADGGGKLKAEENDREVVLRYQNARPVQDGPRLVNASLTLRRSGLHAVEQSFVIEQENDSREYRLVETGYTRQPDADTDPSVFEPEPRLFFPAVRLQPALPSPLFAPVTTEQEIEVLRRLDTAQALAGEQLELRRTDGVLTLRGVVESPKRRDSILRALGPFTKSPSLKVRVNTVAELQRRAPVPDQTAKRLFVDSIEVSGDRIPADAAVRAYLARRGITTELDLEVQRFSEQVTGYSMQARMHAQTLREIAGRFTAAEIAAMTEKARAEWLALISQHVNEFLRVNKELRASLQPISPDTITEVPSAVVVDTESDLKTLADGLIRLAKANDDAVGRSFRLSTGSDLEPTVNTPRFWPSMYAAEVTAAAILRHAQQ